MTFTQGFGKLTDKGLATFTLIHGGYYVQDFEEHYQSGTKRRKGCSWAYPKIPVYRVGELPLPSAQPN